MSFGYQILGFGAYPNRVTAEVIVPVAITYVSTAFNGDASTSQTFSSQSLGTAFAGRRIVVAALAEGNAGQTITGITVGGVTLDLHVRLTNGNTEIAIGSRKIATGTAADIIVVTSGQKNRYGIGVWQTNGFPAGLGITDTGTTLTTSTGNDTLAGGGMIAMAGGPSDNPVSWTGVTERYDALVDGFEEFHSGGDEIFEDAQDDRTVSVSTNKNDAANSLGVVSFNSPNRVISVDFIGNTVNSGSSTAYTFSSHDIGEAASNRKIILAIGNAHSTAVAVTAVTVGGISGTEVISQASNNNAFRTQIWQVDEVASGTSADIVVTFASSTDCCGIGVWAAYGASTIPHQFKSDDGVPTLLSEDIDVPA